MKILLINPLIAPKRPPSVYNIGLGYVAASLIHGGHDVAVLDIEGYRYPPEKVPEMIRAMECDAIGIGTLITGYKYVKWLINEIRKTRPKVPIWMGNSIASTIPDIILKDMDVDVVVMGEGEETVKELAKATESGDDLSKVDGICFRRDGRVIHTPEKALIKDIDTLPLPAWDLFPQSIYMRAPTGRLPLPVAYISTTRGCPYNCTYCYHPFQNRKVRMHSAERVAEEIKILKKRYNINSVVFADDLFMVNKKRVHEICDLIEKDKLNIKWLAASRVNTLDEDVLRHMRHAGCICLGFGVESGSQKILDNIKKNATVSQAKDAIRLCRKAGIDPSCSFMIGNVGETRETIFETVSFITENILERTSFFFATPYPDTELYEYAKNRGKIKDEISLFKSYGEQSLSLLVNFTDMPDDDLLKLKKEAESVILRRFILRRPHKYVRYLWMIIADYYAEHGALKTFRGIAKTMCRIIAKVPLWKNIA